MVGRVILTGTGEGEVVRGGLMKRWLWSKDLGKMMEEPSRVSGEEHSRRRTQPSCHIARSNKPAGGWSGVGEGKCGERGQSGHTGQILRGLVGQEDGLLLPV